MPGHGQSGLLLELMDDGSPAGDRVAVPDLVAAVREQEEAGGARWVWPSAAGIYHRLLHTEVRVARCHDVALAEALISGRDAALAAGNAGRGVGEAEAERLERARDLLQAYGVASADTEGAARPSGIADQAD